MNQGDGTFAALVEALPRQQKRLMNILQRGGHYSVGDITIITGQSDPRGHISRLRSKGFSILDEWCQNDYGDRYKRYFLSKEYLGK